MSQEVLSDNKITLHISSDSETGLLSALFNGLTQYKDTLSFTQTIASLCYFEAHWLDRFFACCGNCHLVLAFSSTDTKGKNH